MSEHERESRALPERVTRMGERIDEETYDEPVRKGIPIPILIADENEQKRRSVSRIYTGALISIGCTNALSLLALVLGADADAIRVIFVALTAEIAALAYSVSRRIIP